MAKPICVIYYNPEVLIPNGRIPSVDEINGLFEHRFQDYNTFAFPSSQSNDGSCEDVRFEVFNADKMDEIALEEFKKEILETLLVV